MQCRIVEQESWLLVQKASIRIHIVGQGVSRGGDGGAYVGESGDDACTHHACEHTKGLPEMSMDNAMFQIQQEDAMVQSDEGCVQASC